MALHFTSLDDAAWTSPWRAHATGDKALLSLGLVLTALLAPPLPGGVLVAVAACAVLLGPARLPARLLAAALAAPVLFVLIGALSVAVAVGEPVPGAWWVWGPLSMGPGSLRQAGALLVHGVAGAAAVMVLATTTPLVDLVTAGRRLRIPDAVLEVASLTYRLVFVLLDTTSRVREAQRARLAGSARAGVSSPVALVQAAGSAAGTVLVRSWDRARRLADGLAGRGYEDALTTLPVARAHSAAFLAGSAALISAVWALSWWWPQGWVGLA